MPLCAVKEYPVDENVNQCLYEDECHEDKKAD